MVLQAMRQVRKRRPEPELGPDEDPVPLQDQKPLRQAETTPPMYTLSRPIAEYPIPVRSQSTNVCLALICYRRTRQHFGRMQVHLRTGRPVREAGASASPTGQ